MHPLSMCVQCAVRSALTLLMCVAYVCVCVCRLQGQHRLAQAPKRGGRDDVSLPQKLQTVSEQHTHSTPHHGSAVCACVTAYLLTFSLSDPIPKRVDVDVTVKQEGRKKVINWVDPQDKVVF